jgi:hypothetical protein
MKTEQLKSIQEWEVQTPTGWQSFDGIKKVDKESYIKIQYVEPKTNLVKELICTNGHQLKVRRHGEEVDFCFAELVDEEVDELVIVVEETGRVEYCKIASIEKVHQDESKDFYDLINVQNGFEYYDANGLVHHNCAWIDNIDELWVGLQPTLSTGGDVIFISSPSGVGTFFHNMWVDAEKDKKPNGEGANGFFPIELPWMVHPERDEKWFQEQRAALLPAMGERGISQELLCQFGSSGHTFISADTMDLLFASVQEPVEKRPVFLANQGSEIWIWRYPIFEHKYIIGADVASGQGDDNSAFHIVDTNTDEVVAEFAGKITPDKFASVLLEWANVYNKAMICHELNNHGLLTSHVLKESKYENLYYANRQENIYGGYNGAVNNDDVPGFVTSVSNRDEILIRLENALRNKLLRVYSKRLFTELQTFIYKKNSVSGKEKVQARKGHNDDLVMSLAITCVMFEAKGKTGYGSDTDAMWAMVKGMSRNTQTMNTTTGKTSDGLFSVPKVNTGNQTPQQTEDSYTERTPSDSLRSGGRIDYNQPYWKQWKWVGD